MGRCPNSSVCPNNGTVTKNGPAVIKATAVG